LYRRLGRPQNHYGCCEEKKNLALPQTEPRPSSLAVKKAGAGETDQQYFQDATQVNVLRTLHFKTEF
jgi:hypothetical protein